jgi:hypothetical protein
VGKLTFRAGQRVNVSAYLKREKAQATRRWLVPAYNLHFDFCDSSIGVVRYVVQLKLDQYGQVLSINLPNQDIRYGSISPGDRKLMKGWGPSNNPPSAFRFVSLDAAIDSATATARKMHKRLDSVSTNLKYDCGTDNLYWVVSFKQTTSTRENIWFDVEVDVQTGEVVKTYDIISLEYD